MRLPKRVPWSSTKELELLYSWIYNDEADLEAKYLAIHRLSSWKAITALPHAIESTLALLVVITRDVYKEQSSYLFIRQSYATAIMRLVNGLVDPLQLGTYARSIAAIAHQLGIPQWLVELRHAATHEDLPSLDLLREAARQSMSWLLHNYYLPTLNPVPSKESTIASPRPLAPLLKIYKHTMKAVSRDLSLLSTYKPKVTTLLRDIERWISESKVVANVAAGQIGWATNWSTDQYSKDSDPKDVWAQEMFCDVLVGKGMLIPLAKNKRSCSEGQRRPNAPDISIWSPLLHHIQMVHFGFPSIFCRRLIFTLFKCRIAGGSGSPTYTEKEDVSYSTYTTFWVLWAIETWQKALSRKVDLRKDTALYLMQVLSCDSIAVSRDIWAINLLRDLCSDQPELQTVVSILLTPAPSSTQEWQANDLAIMNDRNQLLQARLTAQDPLSSDLDKTADPGFLIPGWRKLEKANWNPCPIGNYRCSH